MKFPVKPQNISQSQKIKKSIWQSNTQINKQDDSENIPLTKGYASQRTLKTETLRVFKPFNTSGKANTLAKNNSKKSIYDENAMKIEYQTKKNQRKTYDTNINESIDCVLDQLESYEKIKINSSNIYNSSLASQRYNVEMIEEELIDQKQVKQSNTDKVKRQPFAEITNQICLKIQQKQNSQVENKTSDHKKTSSLISTKPSSRNTVSEEDDENERAQSKQNNNKIVEQKVSQNISSSSQNNTSSASSEDNLIKQQQNILGSNADVQQSTNSLRQKNVGQQIFNHHQYFEGYKVFKKKDKLFTFKVFREDSLKIPAEYSQVITHVIILNNI